MCDHLDSNSICTPILENVLNSIRSDYDFDSKNLIKNILYNDVIDNKIFKRDIFNNKNVYPKPISLQPFVEQIDKKLALQYVNKINANLIVSDSNGYMKNNNRNVMDFIKSTPTCYIIIGKPHLDQEKIARKFSRKYNCKFLNINGLIKREIKLRTKIGQWIIINISLSKKIPIDLALHLLAKEINENDLIKYHGYVLTGIPIIPDYEFTSINNNDGKPYTTSEINFCNNITNEIINEMHINYQSNSEHSLTTDTADDKKNNNIVDNSDENIEDKVSFFVNKINFIDNIKYFFGTKSIFATVLLNILCV